MKSADNGHPSRDFHVHCEWSRRAARNFGDRETKKKTLGLPVNPMNDRKKKDGIVRARWDSWPFLSFLLSC